MTEAGHSLPQISLSSRWYSEKLGVWRNLFFGVYVALTYRCHVCLVLPSCFLWKRGRKKNHHQAYVGNICYHGDHGALWDGEAGRRRGVVLRSWNIHSEIWLSRSLQNCKSIPSYKDMILQQVRKSFSPENTSVRHDSWGSCLLERTLSSPPLAGQLAQLLATAGQGLASSSSTPGCFTVSGTPWRVLPRTRGWSWQPAKVLAEGRISKTRWLRHSLYDASSLHFSAHF